MEYQIESTYEEAKQKAINAVLETIGITTEDVLGKVTVYQHGKLLATINIENNENKNIKR